MRKTILFTALGLVGLSAAFGAQACSSSGSTPPPANEDSGTSTPDGAVTTPVDSGTPQGTDTGTPTSEDAGNWTPSNITAGALSALTAVPLYLGNGDGGVTGNCTADTGAGTFTCNASDTPTIAGTQVALSGAGGNAYVWVLSSLTIDTSFSIDFTGTKPAILVVMGPVSIAGTITSEAASQSQSDSTPPVNTEDGVDCDDTNGLGGGGGGFCGAGGAGFASIDAGVEAGAGGQPYGTQNLVPLVSGGAGGACNGGGAGGGALQISAYGPFSLQSGASISANGGGGGDYSVGGGGGAGGAILIESPSVAIGGTIAVNGGSGGDSNTGGNDGLVGASAAPGGGTAGGAGSGSGNNNGGAGSSGTGGDIGAGGGGAGYIRINTLGNPTISGGVLSPAATTPATSSCYTVGTL